MKKETRNYLLSQVNVVLQECQILVSQLSKVVIDEDDVNVPVPINECQDLWWDDYVSQLSQFSEEFYCLLSPVDAAQSEDLQHVINHDVGEACEQQPCQNQKLGCLLSPLHDPAPGDGCRLHSDDRQSSNPIKPRVDQFINRLLSVISSSSPNYIYQKEWRQKKIDNFIYPDFLEIWRNSTVIFSEDAEEEVVSISSPPPPVIRYPTIDITKCNIRSIANVPKPQKYPILGCSDDPEFYVLSNSCYKATGGYYKCSPHGEKYGYRTNLGIVPVPDKPVHGYVWDGTNDHSDWVLNAVKPSCSQFRNYGHNYKPRGQRKRG